MNDLSKNAGDGNASKRISESVYATILSWIVSGRISPGETVNELAISRQLGVSRTPIHEAVTMLVQEGLIEQVGNQRRMVARFSAADVHDIYEMRIILETEAARRAAVAFDNSSLQELRRLTEQMAAKEGGPDVLVAAWVAYDELFHRQIAMSCGSPRLSQDITRYRALHGALNALHTDSSMVQRALAEHIEILEALERRDAATASQAMHAHLRGWQGYFANLVDR